MRKVLHETIFKQLRNEIIAVRQAGDWLEPESQLAKRFEVSMVTLRNATLALEREGWVKRVAGVGVQVLNWKKQRYVALVIPELVVRPLPLHYHLHFSTALQSKLQNLGWDAALFIMLEEENAVKGAGELMRALEAQRVSAVVSCVGDSLPKKIRKIADTVGTPVWAVHDESQNFPTVDYGEMIREGVAQLFQRGARRIAALFSGPPPGTEITGESPAVKHFCAELESWGLTPEREWIIDHSEARLPGSGWQGFRDLWAAKSGHPDGLLVLDDMLYHDAAQAIYELGIQVPQEIQIVTHSNKGDTFSHPFPVTRLEIDAEEIASLSASVLNDLLEGRTPVAKKASFKVLPAAPGMQRERRPVVVTKF